jgi:hypothetical protein
VVKPISNNNNHKPLDMNDISIKGESLDLTIVIAMVAATEVIEVVIAMIEIISGEIIGAIEGTGVKDRIDIGTRFNPLMRLNR